MMRSKPRRRRRRKLGRIAQSETQNVVIHQPYACCGDPSAAARSPHPILRPRVGFAGAMSAKLAARDRAGRAPTPPRRAPAATDRPAALGFARQRGIAGIADRDQHIPHEAVAADALDRRFAKQSAERRIVEPRTDRQARGARSPRARQASLRGRPGRICSTDRPPGNRRSHRCGCPSRRGIRAGSGLCARW